MLQTKHLRKYPRQPLLRPLRVSGLFACKKAVIGVCLITAKIYYLLNTSG